MSLTALSLFSGIGGIDLGLERAGFRGVGMVERDPFCRSVLSQHFPEVPLHDDVNTFAPWWSAEPRPGVDLVHGGFPCQGHSVAGRKRGTDDERWGWPGFASVVDQVDPPLVLIENVGNLVRTGLLDVLADLAARGFDAWWGRVPAAAMGAPHLRWRLILVAAHPERVELRIEPRWSYQGEGSRTTIVGFDGSAWTLADPAGSGWVPGTGLRPGAEGHPAEGFEVGLAGDRGEPLGDPEGVGRGPGDLEPVGAAVQLASASRAGWWATEPDVGRVAYGVPARMDRLRVLGNAVVPQVAEYVGRLITATFEVTR